MLSYSREESEAPSGVAEQCLLSAFTPSHHFWLKKGKMPGFPTPAQQQAWELGNTVQLVATRSQHHVSILTARVVPGTAAGAVPDPLQQEKHVSGTSRPRASSAFEGPTRAAHSTGGRTSSFQHCTSLSPHTRHSHLVTAL